MSWPADGLPRSHDRGYCHQIVSTFRHKIEGSARREAELPAAILNAGGPL